MNKLGIECECGKELDELLFVGKDYGPYCKECAKKISKKLKEKIYDSENRTVVVVENAKGELIIKSTEKIKEIEEKEEIPRAICTFCYGPVFPDRGGTLGEEIGKPSINICTDCSDWYFTHKK